MKLVIFGLTVSSSWGNGHATIWRGLCRALARRGHRVVFFERDVPYYAGHRDVTELPGMELCLYSEWAEISPYAAEQLSDADVGIVTSYCPDGIDASELLLSSSARIRAFYDLDTPITLSRLQAGESIRYIGPRGLQDFDLVLSYTGGAALELLRERLGAKRVAPLYGCVDPSIHRPVCSVNAFEADLSYLGTYAEDRQPMLEALFVQPARKLPHYRFVLGGSLYPEGFPWTDNILFLHHVIPSDHPAFYCSSVMTLSVTRKAMAEIGYCPSGRLFEAAACGVPILSDRWEGMDRFFTPGSEILLAESTQEAMEAIRMPFSDLARIALAARERTMEEHTAEHRVLELEAILDSVSLPAAQVCA